MLRLVSAIVAALVLSGCAVTSVDRDASAMVGQPIDAAIKRYGYPTTERSIAGRHLYVWRRYNQLLTCDLTVEVDADGKIVNHQIDGQLGACNLL